jgi:tetratricopeptide (TPR) repeat protein
MSYAFISHSRADEELAKQLAQRLGKEKVWIDLEDLKAGDLIPRKLAESIHESKWFILIASQEAMESQWVRYELNVAIMNEIQDNDYRVIAARIDDCEVHPELSPFLYVDCPNQPDQAIDEIVKLILTEGGGIITQRRDRRRQFVDRFKEIAAIEDIANEGVNFILLWGLYGIGKTVLAEQAAFQVFKYRVARFPLTEAHELLRLSLELSARAKRKLPEPSASEEELLNSSIDSVNQLIGQGYIVFFDDIERILEDDGSFPPFFSSILENLVQLRDLSMPVLLASTQYTILPPTLKEMSHIMKVGRLDDKHVLYCLENWLRISDPGHEVIERSTLERVIPHLYGYPLAARFAAYMIAKYSIEILLKDISHFKDLQIDLAKQLLGRTRAKLSDLEAKCLEALTIADTGLSLGELTEALKVETDKSREAVDMLVGALIVFPEDGRLQIHPLLKDYFWSRAYKSGSYKQLAKKLGEIAHNSLPTVPEQSEDFVRLCSQTFRLLMLSGYENKAQELKYWFSGELKDVSRRLYYAKDYDLSLNYLNTYIEMNPDDRSIRLLRARCLTRLEQFDEAKEELDNLEKVGYRSYLLKHAKGLLMREQNNIEQAVIFFKSGLDDRPDYIPLLRDLGDGLERLGDKEGAIKVLRQAYELAPRDPYVVPRLVDVLANNGNIEEALSIIEEATAAFPEEAGFEHRISTLLSKLERDEESYSHAKRAVELDGRLYEAKLHLASLEGRRGNLEVAENLLKELPQKISKRFRRVRDTIRAEIKLKQEQYEAARELIKRYDVYSDPYLADVASRIELSDAMDAIGKRQLDIAKGRLRRGREIIVPALRKFTENQKLMQTYEQIKNLENIAFTTTE